MQLVNKVRQSRLGDSGQSGHVFGPLDLEAILVVDGGEVFEQLEGSQALRLSAVDVSGNTRMPCTLNGNFRRICEFNVESYSTVLRMSSTRTVSFKTSGISNFTRYVSGHANRLPPRM